MGNPKFYSCYVDEGLNMVLRTTIQHAHRTTMEVRVHNMLYLRGALGLSKFLAAHGDDL